MTDFYQIPVDGPKDPNATKWERVNFALRRIFERLDALEGKAGNVTIRDDLLMDGHAIGGGPKQVNLDDDDFVTRSYFRSTEFGKMVNALLQPSGKTPLILSSVSSDGGGGTGDHAELSNLSYATAGHTGFVPDTRTLTTTTPLTIDAGASANLSANRTLAMPVATGSQDGYLDKDDWTVFNAKQNALTLGNLTASSPLAVSATRQVVGGAADISLTIGSISHNSLADLTTGDVHTQYLALSGVRAMTGAFKPAVQTLSFVNPIVGDASTGNQFRVTLTASGYTLGPFSNLTDGQRIIVELIQDGTGGRTFILGTQFQMGTDTPPIVAGGGASKRDLLGAYYCSSLGKLIITGFVRGF